MFSLQTIVWFPFKLQDRCLLQINSNVIPAFQLIKKKDNNGWQHWGWLQNITVGKFHSSREVRREGSGVINANNKKVTVTGSTIRATRRAAIDMHGTAAVISLIYKMRRSDRATATHQGRSLPAVDCHKICWFFFFFFIFYHSATALMSIQSISDCSCSDC